MVPVSVRKDKRNTGSGLRCFDLQLATEFFQDRLRHFSSRRPIPPSLVEKARFEQVLAHCGVDSGAAVADAASAGGVIAESFYIDMSYGTACVAD